LTELNLVKNWTCALRDMRADK